jgi:hypothetical protein
MKAKGWPNTREARHDAIELFKRGFNESPEQYKDRMQDMENELTHEANLATSALEGGKVKSSEGTHSEKQEMKDEYIRVRLPDGSIGKLPASMTADEIEQAVSSYGKPKKAESLKDKVLRYGVKGPAAGFGEFGHKLLNLPSKAAGLVGAENAAENLAFKPGYNYRQALGLPEEQNIADMLIGLAPEIAAGMAVPGANLGKAGKAISGIPNVGKYLHRGLSEGLSQAGVAGALAEKGNEGESAAIAGATQIPFSLGAQLLQSPLPHVQKIGAAILGTAGGAAGGYAANQLGAPDWMSGVIGTGLGVLGNKAAGTKAMMMQEQAGGKNSQLAKDRLAAAERIGLDFLTPSEAYNSPFLGRKQGRLGRTEEGSELFYDKYQKRVESEGKAIQDLLDKIHNAETMGPEAEKLYDIALKNSVPQQFIQSLSDNKIIKHAIKDVLSKPAYQEILKDVPIESFEYWNQVKRALDDMISDAPRSEASIIKKTRSKLLEEMDFISPEYKQARALEERKFVREELESAFDKTNVNSGFAFFKVLKDKKDFERLIKGVRNVPGAEQTLRDMRELFKDFRDVSTVKRVTGLEQVGMKQHRNEIDKLMSTFENMFTGGKFDKEAIDFITSKDWHKQLEEINKISDKRKRMAKVVEVFGKGVAQANAAKQKPFMRTENYDIYEDQAINNR